jgi:hypothetical protein
MRLSIQHPIIQTHNLLVLEQQIKVLERLGQPEALHRVLERGLGLGHVVDGAIAVLGARVPVHGLEHAPARGAPVRRARQPVHVPHGFDGFGAERVLAFFFRGKGGRGRGKTDRRM